MLPEETTKKEHARDTAMQCLYNADIPYLAPEIFASGQWLLKEVQQNNIQNIVLMERSAILLRAGLCSLMKQNEMKIFFTSVDPSSAVYNDKVFEKFFQELTNHPGNTLLLDEYWASGNRIMRLHRRLSQIFPNIKVGAMSRNSHGSLQPLNKDEPHSLIGFGSSDVFHSLRSEVTNKLELCFNENPDLALQVYRKIITAIRDCFLGKYKEGFCSS